MCEYTYVQSLSCTDVHSTCLQANLVLLEFPVDQYGRLLLDWLTQGMRYGIVGLVISIAVILILKVSTGWNKGRLALGGTRGG